MAYIVDPTDPTQPDGNKGATQGDDELRALKGYIQTLMGLGAGINFFRKNIIIGGDFDINPFQRGTNCAGAGDGLYVADRWQYRKSGTVIEDIGTVVDGPTIAQAGRLYVKSLRMNVTTADVAIAAGDFDYLGQVIEGYYWKLLAQVPITLSFWHKHTKIGIYCVAFRNSGLDRSYVAEYSQLVADTWEPATIVIPASPVAGAWDYTNGAGLIVSFARSVGATFQTPANIWTAGNFLGSANQVNSTDAIGNKFIINGIQLEKGSITSPFEQKTIHEELSACQRYCQRSFAQGQNAQSGIGALSGETMFIAGKAGALAQWGQVNFKVIMRNAPGIIQFFNPTTGSNQVRDETAGADLTGTGAVSIRDNGFLISAVGAAGTVVGNLLGVHWTAEAELTA